MRPSVVTARAIDLDEFAASGVPTSWLEVVIWVVSCVLWLFYKIEARIHFWTFLDDVTITDFKSYLSRRR